MPLFENFPYTNFHEMNLDWILQELKKLVDEWDSFGGTVSASAHVSASPEVNVSGDLKDGLAFDFGLVQGPRGQAGPEGPEGPEGPAGTGLEILDEYATLADLQSAHPSGSAGDMYLVGTGGSFTLYLWSTDQSAWVDGGALTSPAPYTSSPAMDGSASAGSSANYSRGDHVHPSDNSKLDKSATDGVYAVESGSQVMLTPSETPVADALVKYDSVGDIGTHDLNASNDITATGDISGYDISAGNDISATGDISASGSISADSINITNNDILNSDTIDSMATETASYLPMGKIIGTDALQLVADVLNNASIKLDVANYNADGTVSTDDPQIFFSPSFMVNGSDQIDIRPATSLTLGGVKEGTNISIAADGTISASTGGLTCDVLWTNASPTSSFADQTILLDLSSYKAVAIQFTWKNDEQDANIINIGIVGYESRVIMIYNSRSNREFEVTSSGVIFGKGTFAQRDGSMSNNNAYSIPLVIFGLK